MNRCCADNFVVVEQYALLRIEPNFVDRRVSCMRLTVILGCKVSSTLADEAHNDSCTYNFCDCFIDRLASACAAQKLSHKVVECMLQSGRRYVHEGFSIRTGRAVLIEGLLAPEADLAPELRPELLLIGLRAAPFLRKPQNGLPKVQHETTVFLVTQVRRTTIRLGLPTGYN